MLFLTTANLATNPRLLKEVLLVSGRYKVKVLMFTLGNWSDEKTNVLIEDTKALQYVEFTKLQTERKPIIPWMFWGVLERLARVIYPLLKRSLFGNAIANSRRSIQLYGAAKKSLVKADIICAHNIGALYPAWKLGRKWGVPFIFDVEDYHPGEFIRHDAKNEKKRREFLMKELLPHAHAVTSASPLIGEYTMNLIGGHASQQVILNSFPKIEFKSPIATISKDAGSRLRMVWFSQKISFGRGLEQLFEALQISNRELVKSIKLTLIGEMDESFNRKIIVPFLEHVGINFVFVHIAPLPQAALHDELSNYDIGLALEPGKDLNNELAVSNKIIAYTQAGLYILATDTLAQRDFMEKYPWSGMACGQSTEEILDALLQLVERISDIRSQSRVRFKKGKALSWERAGDIMLKLFQHLSN